VRSSAHPFAEPLLSIESLTPSIAEVRIAAASPVALSACAAVVERGLPRGGRTWVNRATTEGVGAVARALRSLKSEAMSLIAFVDSNGGERREAESCGSFARGHERLRRASDLSLAAANRIMGW
jgi:hypothetical protein